MENEETNINSPFLIIQKPQELIKLFENLIDRKLQQAGATNPSQSISCPTTGSPFLSSKEVEKIFKVSRQTINDWRRTGLLQSFKIKSRRFFFKEQVDQLVTQFAKK